MQRKFNIGEPMEFQIDMWWPSKWRWSMLPVIKFKLKKGRAEVITLTLRRMFQLTLKKALLMFRFLVLNCDNKFFKQFTSDSSGVSFMIRARITDVFSASVVVLHPAWAIKNFLKYSLTSNMAWGIKAIWFISGFRTSRMIAKAENISVSYKE